MMTQRGLGETMVAGAIVSGLSDTGFAHGVASVAAYDLLAGNPLNPLEGAAAGVVAVEGACELLYCITVYFIAQEEARKNVASQYRASYKASVEGGKTEEAKEYIKKHNHFINNAAQLYVDDEIDFATFKKLCTQAAGMYRTFTSNPSDINPAFIAEFEKNTYVPVLDNNILYKVFWKDLKDALILSVKIAAATTVFLTICSALAAPTIAAFFSTWMTGVLVPSLQFAAIMSAPQFLLNSLWARGNISTARSELTQSVQAAATPSP